MKRSILPSVTASLKIFRIIVALLLFIHGIARMKNGTVDDFGVFLDAQGFPMGAYLALGITLFEIIGAILLILGYFVSWISLIFALELTMGIILVHASNGWFVVGAGTGGVEYSILLIVSFLLIATTDPFVRNR